MWGCEDVSMRKWYTYTYAHAYSTAVLLMLALGKMYTIFIFITFTLQRTSAVSRLQPSRLAVKCINVRTHKSLRAQAPKLGLRHGKVLSECLGIKQEHLIRGSLSMKAKVVKHSKHYSLSKTTVTHCQDEQIRQSHNIHRILGLVRRSGLYRRQVLQGADTYTLLRSPYCRLLLARVACHLPNAAESSGWPPPATNGYSWHVVVLGKLVYTQRAWPLAKSWVPPISGTRRTVQLKMKFLNAFQLSFIMLTTFFKTIKTVWTCLEYLHHWFRRRENISPIRALSD